MDASNRQCSHYQECDAPLCPMDVSKENCLWYPSEDICKKRELGDLLWVANQRKIKNLAISDETYFTLEMLNRKFIIGRALQGIDPDKESMQEELKRFYKHHPTSNGKKTVSPKSLLALKNAQSNRVEDKKDTNLTAPLEGNLPEKGLAMPEADIV